MRLPLSATTLVLLIVTLPPSSFPSLPATEELISPPLSSRTWSALTVMLPPEVLSARAPRPVLPVLSPPPAASISRCPVVSVILPALPTEQSPQLLLNTPEKKWMSVSGS